MPMKNVLCSATISRRRQCHGAQDGAKTSTTPLAATRKLDRAAILRELRDVSLAGMDRRLALITLLSQGLKENFPEIWMPTVKEDRAGPPVGNRRAGVKEAGDFSSTQGQILYVPDKGMESIASPSSNGRMVVFRKDPSRRGIAGSRPEPTS